MTIASKKSVQIFANQYELKHYYNIYLTQNITIVLFARDSFNFLFQENDLFQNTLIIDSDLNTFKQLMWNIHF